jgi:hypothetical protein
MRRFQPQPEQLSCKREKTSRWLIRDAWASLILIYYPKINNNQHGIGKSDELPSFN